MQLDLIAKEQEKLDVCLCKDEPIDVSPDELKDLNNKLAVVNKKLYDSKNRNLELKNEILIATKILQQVIELLPYLNLCSWDIILIIHLLLLFDVTFLRNSFLDVSGENVAR